MDRTYWRRATRSAVGDGLRLRDAEAVLHDWYIEPREYARHEARRGRRHAFEVLDPRRTALVVVDMVPFFVEQNEYARGIVPNIERLAGVLRSSGGVVAWVLPGTEPPPPARAEFLGPTIAEMYRTSGGTGPLRGRIWHQFDVDEADLVVEKLSAGAFFPGRCDLSARFANAAMRDQDLNATLHTIYRSFGDVRPTDELISLLIARSAD